MFQTVGTGLLGEAGAPGSQGYGLADGLSGQRLLRIREGGVRRRTMYLPTLVSPTLMPSLSSSP
jgi:hypothetical protein